MVMTELVCSHSDNHLLLRELAHRVNNEFTSIINTISRAAARSPSPEVKAALSCTLRHPNSGGVDIPVVIAGAITRYSLAFADRCASTDQRSQPSRSWMSGSIVVLLLRRTASAEPDDLSATANLSWAPLLPAAQTCAALLV